MPKYKVCYLVTREEFYEIEAPNIEIAASNAFALGAFIESGETTNVDNLSAEKVML